MDYIVARVLQMKDYSPIDAMFDLIPENPDLIEVACITLPAFTTNTKAVEIAFDITTDHNIPWYTNTKNSELEVNDNCVHGCRSTGIGDYVSVTRNNTVTMYRCSSFGWVQIKQNT